MSLSCLFIFATVLEIHSNKEKYVKNSDVHSHNTRSADLLRPNKFSNTRCMRNSIQLNLYYHLPADVKNLPMIKFKKIINSYLIQNCFYNTSINEYVMVIS